MCAKLNLGGENVIMQKFTNLSQFEKEGAEKVHSLNLYPWPFPDSMFEEVRAENILEKQQDLVVTMHEIWRIAKPNAKIYIIVPWYNSSSNYSDPRNIHGFNFATFDFFLDWMKKTDKNYRIIKIKSRAYPWVRWIPNVPLSIIKKGSRLGLRDFFAYFIGEINQYLFVELEVIKGGIK